MGLLRVGIRLKLSDAPLSGSVADFVCHGGTQALPARLAGAVVALGNFDGLHRGHQSVLAQARALADQLHRPAAFLTFDPHPRQFFRPDAPLFCLTPPPLKAAIAQHLGLQGMITLPFDQALAQTGAQVFIEQLLISGIGVGGLVIGHDFHFGKGREGSPAMIEAIGRRLGLPVVVVPALKSQDEPVSSSAIRAALQAGDLRQAAALLGYRWIVRGPVQHGDKRGRTLGYPTANMSLLDACRLPFGIYAVRMAVAGRVHDGVASFGSRPTFDNGAPRLETYLFDFAGDLYDQVVDVEWVDFIRPEAKFDSVEALIAQMDQDSAAARRILATAGGRSLLPLA